MQTFECHHAREFTFSPVFEPLPFFDGAHGDPLNRHLLSSKVENGGDDAVKMVVTPALEMDDALVNARFGTVNADFGPSSKVFTIERNNCSR